MIHKLKVESGKLILLLLCFITLTGTAQKKNQKNSNTLTKEEIAAYEIEIGQMLNYLQETLSFIGNPEQSVQEKEIIFAESYTKIFQDDKVQIEDDLDTQRNTNLSKDVQAYLKDIDFFFRHVTFTFDIQNVACLYKENGEPYFKVTTNRQLTGVTITNDSVNDVKNRYIEINLDKARNVLKIASIYTTKVNERESLSYWWNSMPSAWKNYFASELRINSEIPLKSVMQVNESDFIYSYPVFSVIDGDTIVTDWKEVVMKEGVDEIYAKLKGLVMMQTVDVSNTKTITTLEPLSELTELQTLNISGTNINDLSPLRNANKLKVLKAANTRIDDLSPLKYDIMLEELDVANTDVNNLSVLEILSNLEKLNINNTRISAIDEIKNCPNMAYLYAEGTRISSLTPLADLQHLTVLNINNTQVNNLGPLSNLPSLQSLKISQTRVSSLKPLQEVRSLKELYCSNTPINDLSPLNNHRFLSKIYCDNTRIDGQQASEFTKENPYTLLIYDTNALELWWNNLPIYWKAVFSQQTSIDSEPSAEQLHEVINMTDLDLSGNQYMQDLMPVSRLTNLVYLNIANTEITSLLPLAGMTNLEYIDLNHTLVESLRPLANMNRLQEVNISSTPINNLEPLASDPHLKTVWADNSNVSKHQAENLKKAVPGVTVVYQTDAIRKWWNELEPNWKTLLLNHLGNNGREPNALEMQQIIDLKTITIEQENTVQTLEPLRYFSWLEKVIITNQGIRDIKPLMNKIYLKELQLQNNPISDLEPLEMDTTIAILNIENTQVDDLSKLEKLIHLRVLNAGGTHVKSLKPLSKMMELEELFVNNTDVKNISPIENLPSLKLLKIYNTKVKSRAVTELQQKKFNLNIVYY